MRTALQHEARKPQWSPPKPPAPPPRGSAPLPPPRSRSSNRSIPPPQPSPKPSLSSCVDVSKVFSTAGDSEVHQCARRHNSPSRQPPLTAPIREPSGRISIRAPGERYDDPRVPTPVTSTHTPPPAWP